MFFCHLFSFLRTIFSNSTETDTDHHKYSELNMAAARQQVFLYVSGAVYQRHPYGGFFYVNPNLWASVWEQLQLHCHLTNSRLHPGSSRDSLLLYTYVQYMSFQKYCLNIVNKTSKVKNKQTSFISLFAILEKKILCSA